uniref:Uncharacterized protein n=1 Tax=Otus sunia TaxID=257818 RepID=A0A8C8BKZ2_9STRI
ALSPWAAGGVSAPRYFPHNSSSSQVPLLNYVITEAWPPLVIGLALTREGSHLELGEYGPNLPGVLEDRARPQDPEDAYVHLVQPAVKFRRFGYDSVMTYNSLSSSKADNWYSFQNFKMKLCNTVSVMVTLKASNGKMLPTLTVFSKSLCYLKEHALNTIQKTSFQTICNQEEITQVITILDIWSAAARTFMQFMQQKR